MTKKVNVTIALPKTRLFDIEYYNKKGTICKKTQIKAKNLTDAEVHFKFFYPNKYIWKISAL